MDDDEDEEDDDYKRERINDDDDVISGQFFDKSKVDTLKCPLLFLNEKNKPEIK